MTLKRCFSLGLILLLVSTGICFSQSGQVKDSSGVEFLLNYNLEKGASYSYDIHILTNTSQEMMGEEVFSEVEILGRISLEVKAVKGGIARIEVYFDSLNIRASEQMEDRQRQRKSAVEKILGSSFFLTVSPKGKIVETVGFDTLPRIRELDIMSFFSLLFPALPAEPICVGQSWQDQQSLQSSASGMKITTQRLSNYTLLATGEGRQSTRLKLGVSSTLTQSGLPEGGKKIMDMYMDADGKCSGEFFFDHRRGVYLGGTYQGVMESTIAMTGLHQMLHARTTEIQTSIRLLR